MSETALSVRPLDEIRLSLSAHLRMAAENCILAGRDLIEAKAQLGHGAWLPFLQEYGISSSTAANWMRVAREITPGSTLAALPYSKALALLSVPAEEREQVAREIHAEDKSAQEIKRLIEERNKAAEAANAESVRAAQMARDRDYWKTQAAQIEQERKQLEQREPQRIEVPPADYADLKRRLAMTDQLEADMLAAAQAAEQRVREAEDRLAMMQAQGAGARPMGDLETLTEAVNRFIQDTQLMAVHPQDLARQEKDADAIIRRLSRHVIELQKAISEAAFQAEGAVV
jgi:hypothetical protein